VICNYATRYVIDMYASSVLVYNLFDFFFSISLTGLSYLIGLEKNENFKLKYFIC
jgi:hypothetical protein